MFSDWSTSSVGNSDWSNKDEETKSDWLNHSISSSHWLFNPRPLKRREDDGKSVESELKRNNVNDMLIGLHSSNQRNSFRKYIVN